MRYKNPDKYRRILDSAVRVFAREGFFRAKVAQIAEDAGMASGTVYLYFKNKEDVLISIFDVRVEEIITRQRVEISKKHDARSRLESLVQTHLKVFQDDPDMAACFQVELRQSNRFMRDVRANGKGILMQYLDLIGEIVEDGRREGAFRDDLPVRLVTHFIFGTLDQVISTWVASGMKYNLASLAKPLTELFTSGIAKHGQAAG